MSRALALRSEPPAVTRSPPELDEITLARAQRGDKAAFRALVVHHQRPVFALLSRMLAPSGRVAMVEDLAQETFVRVHRALDGFGRDGRHHLTSWILTIAARLALDELRRRSPGSSPGSEPIEDAIVPSAWRADDGLRARSLREAIARAVAELPPEQRAVFLLREVHELPYEAISEALDLDLGTVKSRLSRARTALRILLAEIHDE